MPSKQKAILPTASWLPCLLGILLCLPSNSLCAKPMPSKEDSAAPLKKSVEPFYQLTEQFLDFIQPVDKSIGLLEDGIRVFTNHSVIAEYYSDWQTTTRRHTMSMLGYAILTCLGLLFIIIVPLAGCCVFCCRCCCGKCGGRLHHMERKGARCRRNCYGTSLTVLCTVMLCGVVLAFISNQLFRNAMDPKRPDYVFLQATKSLGLAAAELSAAPDRARNDSGRVRTLTAAVVRPAVAGAARKFRDHLIARSGVRAPLDEAEAANRLLADSGRLADELRRNWPALRDDLDRHLNGSLNDARQLLRGGGVGGCPIGADPNDCQLLRDRLAVMKPGGDFDAAPAQCNSQLSSWLPVGTESGSASRLSRSLSETEASLAGLADTAIGQLDTADGPVEEAIAAVNSTDQLLEPVWKAAEGLAVRVSSVHSDLAAGLVPDSGRTRSLEYLFLQVAPYWHLALVLMASLALTILVLYYLGLAFGCCGEAPYDDARCCNRGAAAYLLMAGSGLAFMLAWLLMLAVMLLFLAGGAVDTELCRFLTGRAGPAGYRALDTVASAYTRRYQPDQMRENGAPFQALLGDCRPVGDVRPGLAGALNLPELVNGTKPDRAFRRLSTRSVQLLNSRRDSLVGGLRLRPNLTELIRQAGAARTVDLSACAGSLTTSGSLTAAASADVIRGDPDGAGIAALHRISAAAVADLAEHQAWSRIVDQLDADLIRTLGRLSDQRRRVQQLSDARTRLIDLVGPDGRGGSRLADRLGVADSSIRRSDALSEAIDAGAGANLTVGLSAGLVDAAAAALSGVADCRKISDALNGAVRAPCQSALRPFNGFWAGLGLFLVCLPTCLVFSLKLVNLYRKSSKYERDFEEPDYMAYQGFCPSDTVPLDGRRKVPRRTGV
ncbi:hypothetical protein BOX15_Mlig010444g2 [Macrostomum lignano]|uniref:Prominin-like protein n=2 Tax=Macrostomum lignano TaxID=282301 RepID=A0A267EX25_9PLAT|nr:hypothetical protein BOX15_Mlig010444g2 [Macrostomum lignano]